MNRIRTRLAALGLALGAVLFSPTGVSGRQLAVGGTTPANPTLVISLPNAPEFWSELMDSPVGPLAFGNLRLPGLATLSPSSIEEIESELGFSLAVGDLMTRTIEGLDFYMVENEAYPVFLVNMAFRDVNAPGRILAQVQKEASSATGNASGIAASTVVTQQTPTGGELVSLPAFEMFLRAEGNVLTWTNDRGAMDTSAANAGAALFESEYFQRAMTNLEGEPSHLWLFGELNTLTEHLEGGVFTPQASSVAPLSDFTASMKFFVGEDHLKLASFTHQDDMAISQRLYTMTAPPPDEVGIFKYFPGEALGAFGTNHFDGIALLDSFVAQVQEMPNLPVGADQIERQITASRAQLGFDIRTDLLGNLGPDLGISLNGVAPATAGIPDVDLLFVCGIRDTTRFRNVLNVLDRTLNQFFAPPPPQDGSPRPSITRRETHGGTEVVSYEIPAAEGVTLAPAYAVTPGGMFLLGLKADTVKGALDMAGNGGGGFLASPTIAQSLEQTTPMRNSLFILPVPRLLDLVNTGMALGGVSPDSAEAANANALLEAIKTVVISTTYGNGGRLQEILVQM